MPTWEELDQQFQALTEPLQHSNLQFQWGAAGVHYHLSGVNSYAMRRFQTLATIAGRKLEELPSDQVNDAVFEREVPAERWYEALRHHSGAFNYGVTGFQRDESGTLQGTLYTGDIHQPAQASAVVALACSSVANTMKSESNISSVGQSGGITAHIVSVNQAPSPAPPPVRKPWWKSVAALIGAIAAILAILAYFGIKPREAAVPDDKKTTITSINQSGGITAHTVSVGPQARQMNATLGGQIHAMIPAGSKVSITAVMGDSEAFAFAEQIKDWMQHNGYPAVDGVNQAVFSKPVLGQNISKRPDGGHDIVVGGRQ